VSRDARRPAPPGLMWCGAAPPPPSLACATHPAARPHCRALLTTHPTRPPPSAPHRSWAILREAIEQKVMGKEDKYRMIAH